VSRLARSVEGTVPSTVRGRLGATTNGRAVGVGLAIGAGVGDATGVGVATDIPLEPDVGSVIGGRSAPGAGTATIP
jgi:hypothetical protein